MTDARLIVERLVKRLGPAGSRFELRIDRFVLAAGQITGLMGRSGSGKSTFLDLLAMVSQPTELASMKLATDTGPVDLGAILASGDDVRISNARLRYFGYVLQQGGLLGFASARANIEMPYRLAGRDPDSARIKDMAARIGLAEHLDKRPAQLSGGQRQRVAVLRALAMRPQILLCDEPTASVDEFTAEAILTELAQLAAEHGVAVLLVSHDADLIGRFSHRRFDLVTHRTEDGILSTLGAAA